MSMLTSMTVLQAETETCMRLLGAKDIQELGPRFVRLLSYTHDLTSEALLTILHQVNSRTVERDIYDGEPNLDKSGLWEKFGLVKSKL